MPAATHPRLETVRRQFDRWRAKRPRGTRIPAALWASAVAVAHQGGLAKTSQALRLDYYSLKRRLEAAPPAEVFEEGLMEIALPLLSAGPECVVEIDDGEGRRLRVELRGTAAAVLDAVVTSLWRASR